MAIFFWKLTLLVIEKCWFKFDLLIAAVIFSEKTIFRFFAKLFSFGQNDTFPFEQNDKNKLRHSLRQTRQYKELSRVQDYGTFKM